MNLIESDSVLKIKQFIRSKNFSQYVEAITDVPSSKLIKKFSDWFEMSSIGNPLLSLDSTYQFLLTTEYLFWWDDCEGYGYLPIDNVKLVEDKDLDGVFASAKDDTYGGFIVDDDITVNEKMYFIEDMNELINYVVSLVL